ncbi:hypothetical protein BDN67DRAFT_983259 [Paxillus ammoniavirescens]|nr:hypothetical protein BDN67DRAFT_983259 [Paxillus ammoniavirescens]
MPPVFIVLEASTITLSTTTKQLTSLVLHKHYSSAQESADPRKNVLTHDLQLPKFYTGQVKPGPYASPGLSHIWKEHTDNQVSQASCKFILIKFSIIYQLLKQMSGNDMLLTLTWIWIMQMMREITKYVKINAQQYPMYMGILCTSLSFYHGILSFNSALEFEIEEEEHTVAAEPTSMEDLDWILDLSNDSDVEAYHGDDETATIATRVLTAQQLTTTQLQGTMSNLNSNTGTIHKECAIRSHNSNLMHACMPGIDHQLCTATADTLMIDAQHAHTRRGWNKRQQEEKAGRRE